MKIILIRHGKTKSGLEKRYIGKADEPLCDAGLSEIKNRVYPKCEIVISSTRKRCIETANLIYPEQDLILDKNFLEIDFGKFEGKNYDELRDDPDYIKWLESGGAIAFPEGESPSDFKCRCIRAFRKIISENPEINTFAFVVHGGTIMALMEKFAVPKRNFYDYQVGHGEGFICEFDGNNFVKSEKL